MRPRVDVGVVTWNTAETTVTALRRLIDSDQGCALRVLVHDNASQDGTPDRLAAEVPEAQVEVCEENLGFGAGMNRLVARSHAPWFFALNSDAWPEPGAIATLVAAGERHPRAAAVAPLLRRPDGSVEHSTHPFPSLRVALLDAVGGRRWMARRHLEDLALEGAWHHDRPRRVDWAVGAALLMRRAALETLGGFDERFFMYVEDLEWCWRAHRAGWEVRFDPGAVVRHVGNASGAKRFGERRAAVDVANLYRFLHRERGAARASVFRALTSLAAVEKLVGARHRGASGEADYWRTQLRAHVGLSRVRSSPIRTTWPAVSARGDTETPRGQAMEESGRQRSLDDGGARRPRVSVAVSTRGRAHLLPRLVAALGAQTVPAEEFELVVVDDASPDDTGGVLRRLAEHSAFDLRVITMPERRGPAAGRNAAWQAARGPVVAFTDDDCVPSPRWLASGLAALDGAPRMVSGRTGPPPDQLDLATSPFARVLRVDGARFFETCNAFYRRVDLEASGGFDERFGFGGEDTDLGLRVAGLGVDPVFAPEALVHHDVHPGTFLDALKDAARFVDLPLVVRKHPEARASLVYRRLFWKKTHPSAIGAGVGLLLGLRWPAALALVVPWVHHRLRVTPACPGPMRRMVALPAALALDLCEVGVMARGSLRHRTVLL